MLRPELSNVGAKHLCLLWCCLSPGSTLLRLCLLGPSRATHKFFAPIESSLFSASLISFRNQLEFDYRIYVYLGTNMNDSNISNTLCAEHPSIQLPSVSCMPELLHSTTDAIPCAVDTSRWLTYFINGSLCLLTPFTYFAHPHLLLSGNYLFILHIYESLFFCFDLLFSVLDYTANDRASFSSDFSFT